MNITDAFLQTPFLFSFCEEFYKPVKAFDRVDILTGTISFVRPVEDCYKDARFDQSFEAW